MGRARELIAGAVLALLGVLFAAGAVEVGVRILHLEPDRFFEPDALIGTRHIAGKSGWWTQEDREFVVPVQINGQGWRDVVHPLAKPDGTTRILILGDSFAEAMQVPLEDSFPRRLESDLNRLQKNRVEVVNTGTSGFGTAGELLLLRRDGVKYQPDIVLLMFFPGNDVMNNSPELEKSLVPVYGSDGSIERINFADPPTDPKGTVGKLLARSKAFQYARRLIVTGHPELARRLGLGRNPQSSDDGAIPPGYLVYAPPDGPWVAAWSHTAALLDALQAEVNGIGAKLVVAVVSSREEVYPEWWKEALDSHPAMQGRTWDVDAPRRKIVDLCNARDIPVLELTPIMRSHLNEGPLHFHRDGHWTPAGHRIASEAMANFLVKGDLLTKNMGEGHEDH